jgi:hypothetical protein
MLIVINSSLLFDDLYLCQQKITEVLNFICSVVYHQFFEKMLFIVGNPNFLTFYSCLHEIGHFFFLLSQVVMLIFRILVTILDLIVLFFIICTFLVMFHIIYEESDFYPKTFPQAQEFQNCGVITNDECIICLEKFEPTTKVIKLSTCECLCAYHSECFEHWGKCALCGTTSEPEITMTECICCLLMFTFFHFLLRFIIFCVSSKMIDSESGLDSLVYNIIFPFIN